MQSVAGSLPVRSDVRLVRRQAVADSQLPDTVHPLIRRVLANRSLILPQHIDYSLQHLPDPFLMKGMAQAVARLWQALQQQQRIVVVGDFDADGATSVTLLMLGLQRLGFEQLQFVVPDRFRYGYGLSVAIVDDVLALKPDLLITVDNGISSVEGVQHARQLGMDVIITDHHLPADSLPDANAIINPNQPGCAFPSKALAGVGVAFYLLMALRRHLREQNWFDVQRPEPNLAEYLDLVALGTVADVVPLDACNRILVMQGIQRIRAGRARPGIRQLLQMAGKDYRFICSSDIGFAIAPRLNAAGRLDDMAQGIMLLLTESEELAAELALMLDDLNRDRRDIEQQMQVEARQLVDQLVQQYQQVPRGLCLFHQEWHQGVVGLVASRLKERLHRPVIAFARAENGELKGSGRSIPGVHLRDVLDAVASAHPGLLTRFGGHAMAAGLTLEVTQLAAFEQAFTQQLAALDAVVFEPLLETDGEVEADALNLYVAQLLRDIPWGSRLPEPLFEGRFFVHDSRVLAGRHVKLRLSADGKQPHALDAIWFNANPDYLTGSLPSQLDILYRLSVNHFRGVQTLQLIVENARSEA